MKDRSSAVCSILIPAKNEGARLVPTILDIAKSLSGAGIRWEGLVVNDVGPEGDTESRAAIDTLVSQGLPVRMVENTRENHGFGRAVALGLREFRGDCVVLMMADGSDDPKALVEYFRAFQKGADAVFGTRFSEGGKVVDYPGNKLFVNRLANWFLSVLFWVPYQDFTNAFKLYSRETIQGITPMFSVHFNITIELCLKTIARDYQWVVVPNAWYGSRSKVSNLRIARMGARYLFTALVIWLERRLVAADYAKRIV